MFPVIEKLDDLLPHIKDNPNFVVNKKDDYYVVDYIISDPASWVNPYTYECRGILFDDAGRIMSRRYHKFFNLNERPETSIDKIDLSKKHWILEKLDGSMITPFYSNVVGTDLPKIINWENGIIVNYGNNNIVWGSKAGATFLTPQIEEFVKSHPIYLYFALDMMNNGFTPIFEWCSNKNRIVISYPEDRLVLTAIRNTVEGNYLPYESMLEYQKFYPGIEIIKQYKGTVQNMLQFSDDVKSMQGIEGFVIRFEDGQMIKMKCDEYVLYHKSKNDLQFEKNVVAIIAEGRADDFRVLLSEEDRDKFESFERAFWYGIYNTSEWWIGWLDLYNHNRMTRKEYAIEYSKKFNHSAFLKSIIFKFFDEDLFPLKSKKLIHDEILSIIKRNTSSQTNIDKVRELWNNVKWVYS